MRRLRRVGRDAPRRWGRMNASRMICHLKDSFLMALGEKEVESTGNFLQKTLVKWIAFHLPLPVPKNRPTLREIDQEIGGTPPADFEADLAELIVLIERFANPANKAYAAEHPILGELSKAQWARWGYLHTDHHLRQFGA